MTKQRKQRLTFYFCACLSILMQSADQLSPFTVMYTSGKIYNDLLFDNKDDIVLKKNNG